MARSDMARSDMVQSDMAQADVSSLFRHAVLTLRLTPDAFWALSWREWRMLTHNPTPPPLGRADLDSLMQQFPDTSHD